MIPLKDDNPTGNKPIITYWLIGICVFVFIIELSSNSYRTGAFFYSFGLIPSALLGDTQLSKDLYVIPPFLTIFSSMFVHGGFMHLIGNMLYMWIFADNIEDNLGPKRFITFYLLCGVSAAMTQVIMDTNSQIPMVGASGAIGGVLGAYLINHPNARVLVLIPYIIITIIKIRALYVLGFWFILQFISSGGGVAYAAHIGGFISGMILILFFNKKKTKVIKGPWS